jgi:uncharacterized protein (TIGR03083 family)
MSELSTSREALDLLHLSHGRLAAALDGLSEEQARAQSYDDDWSVAQVASHLGSSAEIFALHLEAGRTGSPAAGMEVFQPIWDEWNAKGPLAQVRDALTADAAFLERLDSLTPGESEEWRLDLFGEVRDLANLLRLRVSENVLHTWDIVVAADPSATLPQEPLDIVAGNLALVARYTGQKHDRQLSVEVRTTGPERAFRLDLGPAGVSVESSYDDTAAAAELTMPTEAFVRLVYGRLDADHTPDSVTATGVDLDLLRATLPGV